MAVREGLREYARRGLDKATFGRVSDPNRALRFLGYGAIGVTGIPIDMLITNSVAAAGAHYVLATLVGYTVAMSWNFVWQRRYVFGTGGNALREYIRYLGVDVTSAAVRTGVVVALMAGVTRETALFAARAGRLLPLLTAHSIEPVTVASLAGIGVAFVVGFLLTDAFVFGGER
jgi:putative flippase GtrA